MIPPEKYISMGAEQGAREPLTTSKSSHKELAGVNKNRLHIVLWNRSIERSVDQSSELGILEPNLQLAVRQFEEKDNKKKKKMTRIWFKFRWREELSVAERQVSNDEFRGLFFEGWFFRESGCSLGTIGVNNLRTNLEFILGISRLQKGCNISVEGSAVQVVELPLDEWRVRMKLRSECWVWVSRHLRSTDVTIISPHFYHRIAAPYKSLRSKSGLITALAFGPQLCHLAYISCD